MQIVEVTGRGQTRQVQNITRADLAEAVPGTSPLKVLDKLPGVSFQSADPFGAYEWSTRISIRGFSQSQLGFTLDGIPLGDMSYGNNNGLHISRAISAENLGRIEVSQGAGALGTASTSNLGGTIETYSRDPSASRNVDVQQTLGSHNTTRTFVRFDSGDINGNSFYLSGLHHEAKAWDFDGRQSNDQVNAKFVHQGDAGKLTVFVDWSDKTEPNEDSTLHKAGLDSPYTRPFLYPDFAAALAYLDKNGAPPASVGANFRNYYSDA